MTNIIAQLIVTLVTNVSTNYTYPQIPAPCPDAKIGFGCLVAHWQPDTSAKPVEMNVTTKVEKILTAKGKLEWETFDTDDYKWRTWTTNLNFEYSRELVSSQSDTYVPVTVESWKKVDKIKVNSIESTNQTIDIIIYGSRWIIESNNIFYK